MKTTIDSAGRIVIPRDIRTEVRLEPGTTVEIGIRDGVVTIEPACASVQVVKEGKLQVARASVGEPLTAETVRRAQEQIRSKR